MFKLKNIKLGKSSTYALWYFLIVVALPTITLVTAGLIYFWQNDLLFPLVLGWLVISVLFYGYFIYWPNANTARLKGTADNTADESVNQEINNSIPERLESGADWSNKDNEIWDQCCRTIESELKLQPDWQTMPDLAMTQLAMVAQEYNAESKAAALHFTVPELLLVISVASNRYRQLVIEYVPYIDKISLAQANTLFEHKQSIQTGYTWLNRVRRTVRLINPASALISELRDVISKKVLVQANNALQSDLKRLLLQEVAQVGIELYSGKLNVSEIELAAYRSQASKNDLHRQYEAAEPLRVLLIGQSNSGKSSLVNALTQELQAEVGALPVTDRLTVHALHLNDSDLSLNLVDTPGLDGSDEVFTLIVEQALEADLIIWMAKATQPARAPDQEAYAKLQDKLTRDHSRLSAPMILALTYIDQLSPKSSWEPPFDLTKATPKAVSIAQATKSARTQIGLPEELLSIPLYLGDKHENYNIDVLTGQIMMLAESALNVQRNRRRLELASNSASWADRWDQAKNLSRVLGQSITRRL